MVDIPEEHAEFERAMAPAPEQPPQPPSDYWPPPRTARSPNLVKIPSGTVQELCADQSCRKRIWKVKHPTTGKLTPAAVEETITLSDGVVVPTGAFPPYLNAAPGRATLPMDGLGYSHFIDCPSSKHFRKR